LFGVVADDAFGGGRSGLQWTFVLMLLPCGASAALPARTRVTDPRDVATAAATTMRQAPRRNIGQDKLQGWEDDKFTDRGRDH
jgi:hypothetical protein